MAGETQTLQRPKKLVVCCDGTWIDSDNGKLVNHGTWLRSNWEVPDASNVTRIGRAIRCKDSESRPQIVYYQAGVGTGPTLFEKLVGGGTGAGLTANVREAYGFLANNYTDGDFIYLTGFSRGAFTARTLAALIGAVGLLNKNSMQHFYRVFEDFERAGNPGAKSTLTKDVPGFEVKATSKSNDDYLEARNEYLDNYREELISHGFSREVDIQAIGVWDTVGALGVPTPALLQRLGLPAFLNPTCSQHPDRFSDTYIGTHVKHAFQALALDERRAAFSPTIWERSPQNTTTTLQQVWFPGVHSNVGGSYDDAGLADVSLAWMMDALARAGLDFDNAYLPRQWLDNAREYPAAHLGPRSNDKNKPDATNNPLERLAHLAASQPHWALTRLYDSARSSITALVGGTADRTPGDYTRPDHATGGRGKGGVGAAAARLGNTQERVHASVRVRLQARGRGYDWRGSYGAWALRGNGWVVEEGAGERGGGWRWVRGEEVLEEAGLGRFEVMLLRCDAEVAEVVLGPGRYAARVVDGEGVKV